jgi:hypothetical protein
MGVLTNDKKLLTMTAAMLCLVVTPAEAACEQADLAGQWAMFMYGDNFETADLPFIFGCTAIINRSGRFNSRSHCPSAELRGSFEVNRAAPS